MTIQTEAQLEAELLTNLAKQGWAPVTIPDEAALFANLRAQLDAHNAITLSDAEFARVRNHLAKGNVFEKAQALRDRFALQREDGSTTWIEFFNSEAWCRNRFQVTSQITIEGRRTNRYDVTLLVNGLPLGQIELKRRGVEIAQAFNQVNRYQRDSFRHAGGLFQFVQIFMISNGVNTRYYANNRHQSFKHTFPWAGVNNQPINRLGAFTQSFLERCHFAKMVAKYVVLHQSSKSLMVLRPYQYHAAEAILHRVGMGRENGHIWHTTGSGKTLTSFKAAQNLTALPKVDKVVFVVDRADLDHQTQTEFNEFEKGSVDPTDNTRMLVEHLADPKRRLVITTIQKLNHAISGQRFAEALEDLRGGRVVFIFDECHRSQFGETHRRITGFFTRAQMFGFTGTPILAANSVGGRTTEDLFGRALHTYVITDAISDGNVLPFSVEYVRNDPPVFEPTDNARADRARRKAVENVMASKEFFEHPDRIEAVTDWIIENHARKTRDGLFGAIMAVGSVDQLVACYDAFERKRLAGRHDLRIATIFTYGANEEDPEADGLIPETDFPDGPADAGSLPRRDRLQGFVQDYNARYGTNETVLHGKGFYNYYQAIAKRMKARDKKPFSKEDGIDILLVVNMFLTGFDAKTVNTIYVDKNLRWHGLIQAFSRTNRILNIRKSHGNVVCFRDLKERTDEAVGLFANPDALATVVVPGYEERLEHFREAAAALRKVVATPDAVDELKSEADLERFVKAFRELMRIRNALESFSEFRSRHLPMPEQEYEDFKSKYLDIEQGTHAGANGDTASMAGILDGLDFELELIRRDEINVAYIMALLTALGAEISDHGEDSRLARRRRKQIMGLLTSEAGLRGKAPLIRKFMEQVMPGLPAGADISRAFAEFWSAEREAAFKGLVEGEGLLREPLELMLQRMYFSGKKPLGDEVLAVMANPPGILGRAPAIARVMTAVDDFTKLFDDGIGDLEDAG